MANHRIAKNNEFSILSLSRTIQSWLEYHISQNRSYVLSESSIAYPIAEYLNQYRGSIEFEHHLEYFTRRRCDLVFKVRQDAVRGIDAPYYFEFKYTQNGSTRNEDEQQRVFDDLMRLNSVDKDCAKKFFLMAGASTDFFEDFQNFIGLNVANATNISNMAMSALKKQSANTKNIYRQMFSFDLQNPTKKINANNVMITSLVDGFKNDYKGCCKKKNRGRNKTYDVFIDDIKKIKTTLQYISPDDCLARLAIWEITKATP